jgi:hypothetical protein
MSPWLVGREGPEAANGCDIVSVRNLHVSPDADAGLSPRSDGVSRETAQLT